MKKLLMMSIATMLCFNAAQAGEYMPYVGFDYVNMTPNVNAKYPDNYDLGSINAGMKFVDVGAVELFIERSMKEDDKINGVSSQGRIYGFGADALVEGYSFSQGAILGSIGYGRIHTKLKYNGETMKKNANALRLGLGGEINPSPDWGFRAMYRYSLADSKAYKNSKEFTIGARYYFY